MHYATYNLPFSYALSTFTWKSKKSLNLGVKSVLQAREESSFYLLPWPCTVQSQKTLWHHAVLCIQNIRSRKRTFIVLKK